MELRSFNEFCCPLYSKNNTPIGKSLLKRHQIDYPPIGQLKISLSLNRDMHPEIETKSHKKCIEKSILLNQTLQNNSCLDFVATDDYGPECVVNAEMTAKINESSSSNAYSIQSVVESTAFSYIMPKETIKVVRSLQKLMRIFGQGIHASAAKLVFGYFILEDFFENQTTHAHTFNYDGVSWDELAEASELFAWKYAMASLGWLGLSFCGKTGNNPIKDYFASTDMEAVLNYLKLSEEDIVMLDFMPDPKICRPCYLVARDQENECLVLALRGTLDAADTCIDLACEYIPWKSGFVHQGMHLAAQWFIDFILPVILDKMTELSYTKLYVTGYSLGGGTGAIFSMMLQDMMNDKQKAGETFPISFLKCYSYGTPSIVSKTLLSKEYDGLIVSIINSYDAICRLSYGTIMDFRHMLLCSSELWSTKQLLWKLSDDECLHRWRILTENRILVQKESEHNLKLFIPGKIYHFYKPIDSDFDDEFVVELSNPFLFKELLFKRVSFAHHLPSRYDDLMTFVVKKIKAEQSLNN